MAEPSLWSWHPEAVNALASVGAAIGTVATAFLLVVDRLRPRPLQILSNLEIEKTILTDAVRGNVYLASEIGEQLLVATVLAPAGYEIASAYNMTPARMAKLDFATVKWAGRLRYAKSIPRDQAHDQPVVRIFIRAREPSFLHWFGRRNIRIEGVMPFRRPARFELRVTCAAGSLDELFRKNVNQRQRKSPPPPPTS